MSRRFGRNQKRRMREALAAETARADLQTSATLATLRRFQQVDPDLRNLQDFFVMVADRVGRESILVNGEAEADLNGPEVRQFRATIKEQFPMAWRLNNVPTIEKVKCEIMHRLEVKAVRDYFAHQIVVRCYLYGEEVGVALSESLMKRSTEEELTHTIGQELARCLAKEIKRSK